MEVYYASVRQRREFGKHAAFTAQGAEVLFDLRPNEEYAQEHIERNPGSVGVQAARSVSEHDANTTTVTYVTASMAHTEGGWPRDVDATEAEPVIRYRKKIEKDEHFIKSVVKMAGVLESLVKCNNAIDIYEEYFPEAAPEPESSGPPSAKTIGVLRDPFPGSGRTAQYVAWHPDGSRRLAVAYCIMEFQAQPEGMPLASALWDLAATTATPESLLQPVMSALTCVNYSLRDASVLGGGLYNGQFTVFDTRKGPAPVDTSPLETSHTDPVFDFAWQQCKTGTEAMTVSTDGSVFWWDIRRLGEPIESLTLDIKGADTRASAVCDALLLSTNLLFSGMWTSVFWWGTRRPGEAIESLALNAKGTEARASEVSIDYSTAAGPTKFLVGTQAGSVMACNRKGGKTPADRIGATYAGHHGPVYAVSRHPTFAKYFLAFGGWSTKLWSEDLRTPLLTTPNQEACLSAGRWSPTRPGVFYTGRQDGMLDVWDYFDKQHEAALSLRVSESSIRTLRVREGGGELAVGCVNGAVTLLCVSASLSEPQPNERATVGAMLERETNREKNLEKFAKEAKVKARRAAEAAKAAAKEEDPKAKAEELAKIEADFYALSGITPPDKRAGGSSSGNAAAGAKGESTSGAAAVTAAAAATPSPEPLADADVCVRVAGDAAAQAKADG